MIHLVIDNKIIRSEGSIPDVFTRENGELFFGGYSHMIDFHYVDGWRTEIIPVHDANINTLSEPFYDEQRDVVTYNVVPHENLPSIEEAKKDKIKAARAKAKNYLNVTDWYVTRLSEKGTAIPEKILTERAQIREDCNTQENEIDSLLTLSEVLSYKIKQR